jgi:porin
VRQLETSVPRHVGLPATPSPSLVRLLALCMSLGLLCVGAMSHAEEIGAGNYQEASPNQGVLGDWGGARTRLYQRGVDFQLGYTVELAYNARGGDSHLLDHADQFNFGATFDLQKLLGWHGSKVQVTITDRNGDNLSADANLGTLMQVQEIFGRGNVFRWTQLWYEQAFFDDKLDVKLGRMGVGEDFMPFSCYFQNLSFCGSLPGNIVSTWFNWPVSQWAVRVRFNFTPEWYAQIGAYQVNPRYLDTSNGLRLSSPSGTIGALLPVELGWTPRLGEAGLPGAYRVGLWYDSSNVPDVFVAANGNPLVQSPGVPARTVGHETGGYAMLQQQITSRHEDRARGLTVFGNFVQADRDTAVIDQLITVGLFYTGPFDARPQDDLGFAVGRTRVNSRVADGQRLQNGIGLGPVAVQTSEYPVELYYSIHATPWLMMRPNLQYIHHPGGTGERENAVVLGLKVSLAF